MNRILRAQMVVKKFVRHLSETEPNFESIRESNERAIHHVRLRVQRKFLLEVYACNVVQLNTVSAIDI
jgi:hypothetical protein